MPPSGKSGNRSDLRAISEAVGTILLLGISVALAGGIALWTSQVEDGEDALIVDLGAIVRGNDIILIHRGGDPLDATLTDIRIEDTSGTTVISGTYFSLSGTSDEIWTVGEEVSIDITTAPDTFNVIVTSPRDSGVRELILKSTLYKDSVSSNLPDIGITRVVVLNTDSQPVTRINSDGTYIFKIEIENFGNDMTYAHFTDNGDNTLMNLKLSDNADDLIFNNMDAEHLTSGGTVTLHPGDVGFGMMLTGDTMIVDLSWHRDSTDQRTLGQHALNVKVIPYQDGEQDYANNYVTREFAVDKLVKPMPFFGPDPGIYDIQFSNDAPDSGEVVTVTVIVQNSGDQQINPEDGVHLVVSLWKPEVHTSVSPSSYDWRVDDSGHEGEWRSDYHPASITYDEDFPTCTIPNIAMLPGSYFFFYFQLEARVDVPGGLQWVYAAIDVYESPSHIEGIEIANGDSTNDNFGLASIQVFPRILLVDDDDADMGTSTDMTSSVLEALTGSGITVNTVMQSARINDNGVVRDGPAFSYVQELIAAPAMEDYDVVIWVTGYASDPLTNNISDPGGGNIQELMKFMDEKGYLMIIGTQPYGGLASYFGGGYTDTLPPMPLQDVPYAQDASLFLYQYMGIKKVDTALSMPSGEGAELIGLDTEEEGLYMDHFFTIDLDMDAPSGPNMEFLTLRDDTDLVPLGFPSPKGILTTEAENLTDPVRVIMSRSFSEPDHLNSDAQYRAISMTMDVTRIKYLNEKVEIIASAMEWFDWRIDVGRDLSVTRMKMYILSEVVVDGVTEWVPVPLTEDNVPKYLDTILIEASVRNNGPTVDGSSVMFYVKGPDGVELPVTPGVPDPRTGIKETYDNPYDVPTIPGQGGEVTIYKLWLAVGVGSYEFRVVVDPYQLVTEISEANNDITYSTSTVTSFVTKNNVLIVDDDSSDDNFADDGDTQGAKGTRSIPYTLLGEEPSEIINRSLEALDIDHEVFTVESSFTSGDGWRYDSGLTIIDLKRYNAIIWVAGDTGDRIGPTKRETLTNNDIIALTSYLDGDYPEALYLPTDHNENVMFIGAGILPEMITYKDEIVTGSQTVGGFVENYLGVSTETPDQGTSSVAFGPWAGDYLETPFVGTIYYPEDFDSSFSFTEITKVAGLDDQKFNHSAAMMTYSSGFRNVSSHFSSYDGSTGKYFRTMLHSWQIERACHDSKETALNEMMFLGLHWFDTPSDRAELVGRSSKIYFENDNPVIGNSYEVAVEIVNLGGVPGGGTVRFMDGEVLIKSISVYLDPDQSTVLDAIWTPLYAGEREFSVEIDCYNNSWETFDNMNNKPFRDMTTYFFWDDMESGSGNWEHDAKLMEVNGESPIDFMDPLIPEMDTNVVSTWDLSMSMGLNRTMNESHSAPYSYHMKEAQGVVRNDADVLVSFVIDDSASMSLRYASDNVTTWLEAAKDAAKVLLDQLSNNSVVISIWDFQGSLVRRWAGPDDDIEYTSSSVAKNIKRLPVRLGDDYGGMDGREKTRDEIDLMNNPPGQTVLWDGIGGAYEDIDYYKDFYPDLNPAIIVLSDGTDSQSSDKSLLGIQKVEAGSTAWAPWDDMANGEQDYKKVGHFGKYTLDWSDPANTTQWIDSLTHGGAIDTTRTGLLYSNIPIYTIGLGLENHDPPYQPEITTKPAEFTIDLTNAYCSATGTQESGTLEYNLWRIANTSDALYFNAPSADELEEVFKAVGQAIADPGSQTRSLSRDTRADDNPEEENFDKWATTETISIQGATSATFSFWHKYDFVEGANGGYIEVGYRDPAIDSDGDGLGTGDWDWKYIIPSTGHYDGNLYLGDTRLDSFGNEIVWGWSGTSGNGRFTWDYVKVDLLEQVPASYRNLVKVRMSYKQYGGGTGNGWWIDDVSLSVSRIPSVAIGVYNPDMWSYITGSTAAGTTHSGRHAWFAGDMVNKDSDMLNGADNSLYTRNIDLTNAENATLSAYFKFNIDETIGTPPDCLRVEVSDDGGLSWISINLGSRAALGVSGVDTGVDEGNGWVNSGTMTRLSTDLSGFKGKVIRLRFRIVTDLDNDHYESSTDPKGVYIDDVVVYGTSLESTRGMSEPMIEPSTIPEISNENTEPASGSPATVGTVPIIIAIIAIMLMIFIITLKNLIRTFTEKKREVVP